VKGHFLILSAAAALVSLALLSAAPAATGSQAARVSAASSSLGRIVVDGRGRTLYLFEKDSHGRSACSGSCAMYWAAGDHAREADRGSRSEELAARHDPAGERGSAGHLRGPPALPVRTGHQVWSDQW
jgi:predicted lipoprotein with Yx(FWY)xxD motif